MIFMVVNLEVVAKEVISTKENDSDEIFSQMTMDTEGDEVVINTVLDYTFTIDSSVKKI